MKVAKDLVVSLAYQVRTEDGVLVDESPVNAPLDYLHGHGSLISGLENALDGHEVGDKFDVAVGANDAYGQYDENLVQRVPKDVFMGVDELQVGMRFLAETDQGPVPVFFKLEGTRVQNSATICATILSMLRRYHESSKGPGGQPGLSGTYRRRCIG